MPDGFWRDDSRDGAGARGKAARGCKATAGVKEVVAWTEAPECTAFISFIVGRRHRRRPMPYRAGPAS